MLKTLLWSIFLVSLISCKENKDKAIAQDASAFEISVENWPKKILPNTQTKDATKNWEEFKSFQLGFDAIYSVSNTEDLSLVLEDLIEKQTALAESVYPEPFNKPQIKSRQKVLHTFILKTKGDLIYSIDAETSVIEMIDAYNAMLVHMNSITSNTLDLNTILEEEQEDAINF